jgi:hypothetical protein
MAGLERITNEEYNECMYKHLREDFGVGFGTGSGSPSCCGPDYSVRYVHSYESVSGWDIGNFEEPQGRGSFLGQGKG